MTAEEWVSNYLKTHELHWENFTPAERFRLMTCIPCKIRCYRIGEPVDVEYGKACPECGKINKTRPSRYEILGQVDDPLEDL